MNFFDKENTGFTIIELLIAISIFAVVGIALYSTFFAGISVWKRSGEGGNVYQDVRFVLDDIAKDLKNAVYCTNDDESIFAFSGMTEEIVFITLESAFFEDGASQREMAKVAYKLNREDAQLIGKRADQSLGFNIENAENEILLEGVERFTFEYCYDSGDEDDPYEWKEEWKDEELRIPRGVRVTSYVKAEEGRKEALKFSKIIFVPTGVLGEEEL